MDFFKEFEHLKIQLEEIKSATDNFADNKVIGIGGFGKVYKGEIFHSDGRRSVAFKRLDGRLGQGNPEFWKEIMMLSRYTHENLVSLLGYCDEGGEKILAYEFVSHGSLDRHLSAAALTWIQRLKICLGVAKGIKYLHDPSGTQQRVIHRDIKSANILLDENWNAKVSDMGLSKISPANQLHTAVVSNVVGTPGYLDPLYLEKGVLTKESDVYSFGVVLFEALCGKLCFEYSNGRCQSLVRLWKESYSQKKLDDIIFQDLKHQMHSTCLEIFSDTAYLCLLESRKERPSMADVVEKLAIALQFQELYGVTEIFKSAVVPMVFESEEELNRLLSKGVLVNNGKTWLSLNKNGQHCELISARGCLNPSADEYRSEKNSRFTEGCYQTKDMMFRVHVTARFLSPGITYTVNLLFKSFIPSHYWIGRGGSKLKYLMVGETESSISYLAYEREDGWLTVELYQFTSDDDGTNFDLDIRFDGMQHYYNSSLVNIVEGIEFQPLNKVEHEASEDEKYDMQPTSDSDIGWIQKLPNDYKQIIKSSKDGTKWRTEKELYYHFRKGFLINDWKGFLFNKGDKWFSLATNGKKCLMLSARTCFKKSEWEWKPLPESRFKEVATNPSRDFSINSSVKSKILSPNSGYACYLVYKITKNHSNFVIPWEVSATIDGDERPIRFIYLLSPQTRVIGPKDDQNIYNPSDIPKLNRLPRLRNDGWMEVQAGFFKTDTTYKMMSMELEFSFTFDNGSYSSDGLLVQGIEFKPMDKMIVDVGYSEFQFIQDIRNRM